MAVSHKPASELATNFADNLCRWDGVSAPRYEVWFLTLNHRASQRGFWFRYTLESPTDCTDDSKPSAAVWAAAFFRAAPDLNFGIKHQYSIDEFSFAGRENFSLSIGETLFMSS